MKKNQKNKPTKAVKKKSTPPTRPPVKAFRKNTSAKKSVTKKTADEKTPEKNMSRRAEKTSSGRRTKKARQVFLTGFPGFISKNIVKRLLMRDTETEFCFLVQQKYVEQARNAVAELDQISQGGAKRMSWLVGDITRRNLGLGGSALRDVLSKMTEVWHLAAVYDIAAGEYVAYQVNVDGTKNLLDMCRQMRGLKKLIYFSTCYVSGTRKGPINESELEMGQGFKNHYEATKFKAELIVRECMDEIPTVIIRPSVVIGDSRTGEVVKLDGPYPMIKTLIRLERKKLLPKKVPLPVLSRGEASMNFVPVDYLAEVACELAAAKAAIGKTFHVCDPNPLPFGEFQRRLYELFGMQSLGFGIPIRALDALIKIPGMKKLTAIDEAFIPYAEHPVEYNNSNVNEALAGRGLHCPDLHEYLPVIVDYIKAHYGALHKAMY